MPLKLVYMASAAMPQPQALGFEALAVPGALHEVFSTRPADALAAACFSLGLLKPHKLIWARQEKVRLEAGEIYPPGLVSLGFDPTGITLVRLSDQQSVLQAGLEAARTKGLPAAIIELWGGARPYSLTASRKLTLAAKSSGIRLFVLQHAAEPAPSSAETRWQVRRLTSRPLAANAPGFPAFEVKLLRHRNSGKAGQVWSVEWNHEQRCFEERKLFNPVGASPLFKFVVPVSAFRKIPLLKAG